MPLCTIPARGLTLGYDDRGTGTPVVLLHAFPLDRTMWRGQLDALSDAARVLTLDLPGFGESAPAAFTVDSAADVVADFLTALGIEKAVVGGLSMGGYVALAFARRHANRLLGLILADTRAEPDDATGKANRAKTISLAEEKGAVGVADMMIPKVLSEQTRTTKPDVAELVRSIAARQSTGAVVAALAALRDRPDAVPGLAAVTVPALVLVGEYDAVTPPLASAALAGGLPHAELTHIPGAGHLSNLENPAAFDAAVRGFVKQLG